MDSTVGRLRQVPERRSWALCWRCRQPYSFEDLRFAREVDGEWLWECVFCKQETKRMGWTLVQRLRAHKLAAERLAEAMRDQ